LSAGIVVLSAGLALLCGCAATAPWLQHADDKPYYESAYFRVASPKGGGWKAVDDRPSEVLEKYGFHYEPDLFDGYIPPRFEFERYSAKNLLGSPTQEAFTIEFYSTFTRPGQQGNTPRELAEAENRRTLSRVKAQADTLVDPRWALARSAVAKIGGRDYYEFVMSNGAQGKGRRSLLQYISLSKDYGVACAANVMCGSDSLPAEARGVIAGLEPVERAVSDADAAMERAAQELYELTLKRFEGRSLAVYPGDIEKDLHAVLQADPGRKNARLFSGAVSLLTEDLGPVLGEAVCPRVKLGLWDFYCVTDDGTILHSLFDGYSLLDRTLEEFGAELETNPRSFWAGYYLAGLYIRHEKHADAEVQARLLTKQYPESALAWYTLGIALKRAGNKAGARIAFEQARHNYRGEFDDKWSDSLAARNIIEAQLRSLNPN
jgi:tetratricopeptide (TPR) repeat protein